MWNRSDVAFMRECLRLAAKGRGHVSPNPMVGAVIVKNGRVIGTGYHHKVGLPHAEIEALRNVKGSARGATLYTTLEPCSHHGRTPPCTDAIEAAGLSRVVFGSRDPNQRVRGNGAAILRRLGIRVTGGLLRKESDRLNEAFMTFHGKRRPFIVFKFAASLDGAIGTRSGDSKWISNARARRFAHELRGTYQAILVGSNTVTADDPHLGARLRRRRDPLRIILDSRLRIPLASKVLRDSSALVVTGARASERKINALRARGIEVVALKSPRIMLPALMRELYKREIVSVLVEGGAEILGSFRDAGLVDKVHVVHAPILVGGKDAKRVGGRGAATIGRSLHLRDVSFRRFGDNMMTTGYAVRYP